MQVKTAVKAGSFTVTSSGGFSVAAGFAVQGGTGNTQNN